MRGRTDRDGATMNEDMDCSPTQTEEPCAGVIVTDADGNFIERYACEVHLLDPGPICAWQQAVYDERRTKR